MTTKDGENTFGEGIRCSFCNKKRDFVRKMIAGNDAYICDECVALCARVVKEDLRGIIDMYHPRNFKKRGSAALSTSGSATSDAPGTRGERSRTTSGAGE